VVIIFRIYLSRQSCLQRPGKFPYAQAGCICEGHSVRHSVQIHHLITLGESIFLHLEQVSGCLSSRSSSHSSFASKARLRSAGVIDAHIRHKILVSVADTPAVDAISTSVRCSLSPHVSSCLAKRWPCSPHHRQYVL
jgi:hypothetical protein